MKKKINQYNLSSKWIVSMEEGINASLEKKVTGEYVISFYIYNKLKNLIICWNMGTGYRQSQKPPGTEGVKRKARRPYCFSSQFLKYVFRSDFFTILTQKCNESVLFQWSMNMINTWNDFKVFFDWLGKETLI